MWPFMDVASPNLQAPTSTQCTCATSNRMQLCDASPAEPVQCSRGGGGGKHTCTGMLLPFELLLLVAAGLHPPSMDTFQEPSGPSPNSASLVVVILPVVGHVGLSGSCDKPMMMALFKQLVQACTSKRHQPSALRLSVCVMP